ncbi:hypothetical protein J3R83DRAFT_7025 [Lanmaoa asiatica]|nr:hypothetical protein J3R83DRAFT_7025 [Lanmaoa asiatica]
MSSSALSVYPHLPPTTNILGSEQRERLIRSTRKLGAVLGTTPYILENDTSFTMFPLGKITSRASKRQGSIFTHRQLDSLSITSSSTSTTSSCHPSPSASSVAISQSIAPGMQSTESLQINPPGLHTTRRRRSGDEAPQLCLRLNTAPVSLTDGRVASSLSPCTPLPPTPTTPTEPNPSEIRRKRMAKLSRHLGETIPTELVFAAESAPRSVMVSPSCPPRKPTQSVHGMRTKAAGICDNRPTLGQSEQDWVGEWNRSNIIEVQKELRNLRVR